MRERGECCIAQEGVRKKSQLYSYQNRGGDGWMMVVDVAGRQEQRKRLGTKWSVTSRKSQSAFSTLFVLELMFHYVL